MTDQDIDQLVLLGQWYLINPDMAPAPIGRKYFNSRILL